MKRQHYSLHESVLSVMFNYLVYQMNRYSFKGTKHLISKTVFFSYNSNQFIVFFVEIFSPVAVIDLVCQN